MATKGTRSTKNPNGDAKQQWGGDESGGHFLNAEARRTRRSAEEVLLDGVRGTGTGCAIGHMDTASGLRRNRCQSLGHGGGDCQRRGAWLRPGENARLRAGGCTRNIRKMPGQSH